MSRMKSAFDWDLFCKRMAHAEDSNVNERNAFVQQAIQQCLECVPPVAFCAAVARIAGAGEGEHIEQLEKDLADRENQIETLTSEKKSWYKVSLR